MPELACVDCGRTHPEHATRCACGGALDGSADPAPITPDEVPAPGDREAIFELAAPRKRRVTLGAGSTPLVEDEELGAAFKVEGANPTGSFKDRGASTTVGAARAFGAERVTEDSSGNAGAAIAAYAARAGLDCTVFSPEHVTDAKRRRMQRLGATVNVVEGPRSEVTDRAAEAGQAEGAYYASHTYPPWFLDGCATMAYELVGQLDDLPETIVAPAAMGSVVLGLHRGLERLEAGGAIDELPRLVAVQAAGCAPVAERFRSDPGEENRLADGLLVPDPPRLEQMVDAIEATGGTALAVTEDQTRDAMDRLHARGLLCEASSATALAGIDVLREEAVVGEGERPVAVLTGAWSPKA